MKIHDNHSAQAQDRLSMVVDGSAVTVSFLPPGNGGENVLGAVRDILLASYHAD